MRRAVSDTVYRTYEHKLLKDVQQGPVPGHVAIIMDGNRRFADSFGLGASDGHEMGRDKLEELLDWCVEVGIRVLTVYAFSTENLNRDPGEVEELMSLFAKNFRKAGDDERVHKHRIRIRAIGNLELLPQEVQEAIRYAEERTAEYTDYSFNLAVAYGGREEILNAIRLLAKDAVDTKIAVDDIDEDLFSKYLYTSDIPDPDLILRTSGEERISNFLLWQLAYSELYFTDVYWPGFRKVDFLRSIRAYQLRKRRYGK
ncbi:MAG: di-trans,poly-cis-decaprenylcistransferase [Thermoplasmata archaeon]|nr:di-trans,poly-cis-decaprenylcistransferase [Thermoplasmata archaeon]